MVMSLSESLFSAYVAYLPWLGFAIGFVLLLAGTKTGGKGRLRTTGMVLMAASAIGLMAALIG
ncbi:hypothetical protein YTPLAS18_15010 [Nitrospira sp.]|nr:hypothetical protein YTPLAS18_15010 [Nitrospira sp.]